MIAVLTCRLSLQDRLVKNDVHYRCRPLPCCQLHASKSMIDWQGLFHRPMSRDLHKEPTLRALVIAAGSPSMSSILLWPDWLC